MLICNIDADIDSGKDESDMPFVSSVSGVLTNAD
jgi:hypothetical protein